VAGRRPWDRRARGVREGGGGGRARGGRSERILMLAGEAEDGCRGEGEERGLGAKNDNKATIRNQMG